MTQQIKAGCEVVAQHFINARFMNGKPGRVIECDDEYASVRFFDLDKPVSLPLQYLRVREKPAYSFAWAKKKVSDLFNNRIAE